MLNPSQPQALAQAQAQQVQPSTPSEAQGESRQGQQTPQSQPHDPMASSSTAGIPRPPASAHDDTTLASTRTSPSSSSSGTTPTTTDARSREPTVPAACLGCRSKHLKCDGQNPCSRCVSYSISCVYVASRRGYKGPRRATAAQNPNKRQATSPPEVDHPHSMYAPGLPGPHDALLVNNHDIVLPGISQAPIFGGPPPAFGHANSSQLYRPGFAPAYPDLALHGPLERNHGSASAAARGAAIRIPTLAERCLESFYRNFHAAHPFVLPSAPLLELSKDGTIEPLLAAMRWVGSLHLNVGAARTDLLERAESLVRDSRASQDGFLLQAMMVLMIGLDGSKSQEKAREYLDDAEKLAVRLAINTRPFAVMHGRNWPVLEESWRRTWWELFVVDGMIAGVHRVTNFNLFDLPADCALPCEEHEFLSGNIPSPMSLEDLENREFTGDDREFSSFAYRVLAGRNLGKFMRVGMIYGPDDENLTRVEALITNWKMHLPQGKKTALHKDGKLDEMMFQAHMMTHAMSILLHQPHSHLDSSPTKEVSSCAPHRPVLTGDFFNSHTRHTITSANEISKMVTHPVPLLTHTHFFACVVTLSSIVHLSKWALHFVQHDDDDLRQQIRLNIGALATMSTVWACSGKARDQVKGVAQEIYAAKKQLQSNNEYWVGLTQQEVLDTIATDQSIIGDIETISGLPDAAIGSELTTGFR